MSHRRRTAVAVALVAVALSACGAKEAGSSAAPSIEATSVTEVPVNEDRQFREAMADHVELITTAGERMTEAAEAMGDGDVDEAERLARLAARDWRKVRDAAEDLPGSDGELGQLTITAAETCIDAFEDGADAIAALDATEIELATMRLKACRRQLDEATEATRAAS